VKKGTLRMGQGNGSGENCIMSSLMICTADPLCRGDKIEKNDLDGACSLYGGGERHVQGFGGETRGKETTGETQA
jgi:hypothetical protein